MHFVPGSHLAGVLGHHHIGDDPTVHGLQIDEIDDTAAVAVPVPAGGASVHHCRTLHYAGPNTTDRPRRAYTNVFTWATGDGPPGELWPWIAEEWEALRQAAKKQER